MKSTQIFVWQVWGKNCTKPRENCFTKEIAEANLRCSRKTGFGNLLVGNLSVAKIFQIFMIFWFLKGMAWQFISCDDNQTSFISFAFVCFHSISFFLVNLGWISFISVRFDWLLVDFIFVFVQLAIDST